MLITMLASGTRGDTQPYIALGIELKKLGLDVRISASESYRELVESYGFDYAPIRGDVTKIIESGVVKEADNPFKFFSSLKNDDLMDLMVDAQEDQHKACEGADAIVYHPGSTLGYFVAKEKGIPSILASPFPMVPTNEYPAIIFYDKIRLGKLSNKLTHLIFEKGFWKMANSGFKRYWKEKNGELPKGFTNPYPKQRTKNNPTIVSLSPSVFPVPKDWPNHVYSFGYWFIEDQSDYQPSQELHQFLNAGDAPIYVGFGSVGDKKRAKESTKMVLKALNGTGKRAIINAGGGMEQRQNTKDVFFVKSVPHEWLFPYMSAVVHHGGAGTTAASIRSGVPQVIIPFGNDQFAWGRRIKELGVGAKAIPRKELTAEKLADAIRFTQTASVQKKAKQLGKKVKSERGAKKAAELVLETIKNYQS
ncbi:glycosyltransferase [Alkalihalophilus lindianensis]|uniref:Glycosyltransferase n=1 Tax=Alkalihalophilus lindianensis TaxID=1630542 RepID=A0ABU3XDP7_9BACI|nr:glycosyltransferase [Alkalihalophilus lindianensis]MDV2685559.1 glycosyltransferase [Alkalihalophilus lindianensis]